MLLIKQAAQTPCLSFLGYKLMVYESHGYYETKWINACMTQILNTLVNLVLWHAHLWHVSLFSEFPYNAKNNFTQQQIENMLHMPTNELMLLVPPSIMLQTTYEQQHWECELWGQKGHCWEDIWYVHIAGVTGHEGAGLRAHEEILFLMFSKEWAIIWVFK